MPLPPTVPHIVGDDDCDENVPMLLGHQPETDSSYSDSDSSQDDDDSDGADWSINVTQIPGTPGHIPILACADSSPERVQSPILACDDEEVPRPELELEVEMPESSLFSFLNLQPTGQAAGNGDSEAQVPATTPARDDPPPKPRSTRKRRNVSYVQPSERTLRSNAKKIAEGGTGRKSPNRKEDIAQATKAVAGGVAGREECVVKKSPKGKEDTAQATKTIAADVAVHEVCIDRKRSKRKEDKALATKTIAGDVSMREVCIDRKRSKRKEDKALASKTIAGDVSMRELCIDRKRSKRKEDKALATKTIAGGVAGREECVVGKSRKRKIDKALDTKTVAGSEVRKIAKRFKDTAPARPIDITAFFHRLSRRLIRTRVKHHSFMLLRDHIDRIMGGIFEDYVPMPKTRKVVSIIC